MVHRGPGQEDNGWLKPPEHHWYHLQSISNISEVRGLHRAQRYSRYNTHPATVCSCCCHLTTDQHAHQGAVFPPQLSIAAANEQPWLLQSYLIHKWMQTVPIHIKDLICLYHNILDLLTVFTSWTFTLRVKNRLSSPSCCFCTHSQTQQYYFLSVYVFMSRNNCIHCSILFYPILPYSKLNQRSMFYVILCGMKWTTHFHVVLGQINYHDPSQRKQFSLLAFDLLSEEVAHSQCCSLIESIEPYS